MDTTPRGPTGSAAGSIGRIWGRLRRPLDPYEASAALLGLTGRQSRQFVSTIIAASDEATALVQAMPSLIRSLSISTISVPERSIGAVRGPILWSETLSARAASAGDPAVFVCATSNRAYDTDENRVLVLALRSIQRGGRDVDHLHRLGDDDHEGFVAARRNSMLATRFLEHRALSSVTEVRKAGRALQRVRNSRSRNYGPALDMIQKVAEPLSPEELRTYCDSRTTAQHDLVVAVLDHVRSMNVPIAPFTVVDGELRTGSIRYRHARCRRGAGPGGIFLGSIRVDVPESLTAVDPGDRSAAPTSPITRSFVVTSRRDVVAAVQHAVQTGEI